MCDFHWIRWFSLYQLKMVGANLSWICRSWSIFGGLTCEYGNSLIWIEFMDSFDWAISILWFCFGNVGSWIDQWILLFVKKRDGGEDEWICGGNLAGGIEEAFDVACFELGRSVWCWGLEGGSFEWCDDECGV